MGPGLCEELYLTWLQNGIDSQRKLCCLYNTSIPICNHFNYNKQSYRKAGHSALTHTKVDYILLKVQLRCVCVKLLPKSNQLKPCREQVKKETNKSQQRTFIIIQDQLYKTKPMHENKQNMLHANIILKYALCKFSCEIIVLLMNRLVKPLQN